MLASVLMWRLPVLLASNCQPSHHVSLNRRIIISMYATRQVKTPRGQAAAAEQQASRCCKRVLLLALQQPGSISNSIGYAPWWRCNSCSTTA